VCAVAIAARFVRAVKPAFEEDDAQVFLAFHCATVEVKIEAFTFF
jgi:hypothetical protein